MSGGFFTYLILIMVVGSFIALLFFILETLTHNDPIFFLRKSLFKKKLTKKGHESTSQWLLTLLQTNENDWKKDRFSIQYEPFPNTRVQYLPNYWSKLLVLEGAGEKQVFKFLYELEKDEHESSEDPLTHLYVRPVHAFQLKQVMLHLESIYEKVFQEEIEPYKKEKEEERTKVLENGKTKKEQFLSFLENVEGSEDFCIQYTNEESMQSFSISFKRRTYFQAIKLHGSDEIKFIVHHQKDENSALFLGFQDRLLELAEKEFNQKQVIPI